MLATQQDPTAEGLEKSAVEKIEKLQKFVALIETHTLSGLPGLQSTVCMAVCETHTSAQDFTGLCLLFPSFN